MFYNLCTMYLSIWSFHFCTFLKGTNVTKNINKNLSNYFDIFFQERPNWSDQLWIENAVIWNIIFCSIYSSYILWFCTLINTANHIVNNVSKIYNRKNWFILKMTNVVDFGGTWFVFFRANNALCAIISVKYIVPINFPTLDI